MLHAKQSPKRKRRCESLPILGVAGLSFTLASGASAAERAVRHATLDADQDRVAKVQFLCSGSAST